MPRRPVGRRAVAAAQAEESRKAAEQLADSIAEPAEEFKTPAKKTKTSKKKTSKKKTKKDQ